jgi:hypothetical protein
MWIVHKKKHAIASRRLTVSIKHISHHHQENKTNAITIGKYQNKLNKVIIAIDPGVTCGWAVKQGGKIQDVRSYRIWELFEELDNAKAMGTDMMVICEDARLRKWFGAKAAAKAQGAGWIKILCGEIEDFLIDREIPYKMSHPIKNGTKLNQEQVEKITGYKGRTNSHQRDAIMIAHGN